MEIPPLHPPAQPPLDRLAATRLEDQRVPQTDELVPTGLEITNVIPLGTAHFPEDASLTLTLENNPIPLVVKPAFMTILGRTANSKLSRTVIDLSVYDAHLKGVSRLHAVLHRHGDRLELEDMSSLNGTYINGQKLVPRQIHVLRDGDEIRLGTFIINIAF